MPYSLGANDDVWDLFAMTIEGSEKGLNEVVLDETKVKRDRGNVSIPLVCASRESRAFAFLSPKEAFAEVSIRPCRSGLKAL